MLAFIVYFKDINCAAYSALPLQVLEVVRNNYDSLTLKLHDSLDQYEKYAEKPQHANFFANMVCRSSLEKRTVESLRLDPAPGVD